ncbi:DUF5684 domain-containing protein [Pseudodesulfovibrio sediminis]
MDIAGLPKMACLIMFLPFVNILFFIYIFNRVGIRFGLSKWLSIFLSVFPFVLVCLTGFMKAKKYDG